MKQWLMALLRALEVAVPPPTGGHHAITAARYGSDETGWEDHLALHLMTDGARVTLFLDDYDFAAAPETVAAEILQINNERQNPPNTKEIRTATCRVCGTSDGPRMYPQGPNCDGPDCVGF